MKTLQRSGAPQAIQTRYKGCNFRSRTEARWAVVFDALGWKWQYEPEGFNLPNGDRYLPDFSFSNRSWVEVKGYKPDAYEASQIEANLMLVVLAHSCATGWVIYGPPQDGTEIFIFTDDPEWRITRRVIGAFDSTLEGFDAAVEAGRSARFEHGESGRT